uniref:Odorant receptor n=1 Tax=Ceracris kiangsu TaxID=227354 RepID=A0A6M6DK03_CERKI|nr:odorant receptor 72 [Ceracris kiangsu]
MEAEIKSLVGPSGWALQQVGVWRPVDSGPAGLRLLAAVFVVATDALVSTSSLVQLVVDTPTDPETLRDVFFQSTCSGAWAIRAVMFMQKRRRLQRLLVTLLDTRKRYAEEVPGIRKRYDRSAAILFFAWQMLPLTAISLWALEPATAPAETVVVGNATVVLRREPLVLWLPIDTQQSPAYEGIFALQVVGIATVSEVSVLLDIFFVTLMIHVTAEIAVLNANVTRIRLSRLSGKARQPYGSADATAVGQQSYKGGGQLADGDGPTGWSAAGTGHLSDKTLFYSQDMEDTQRRLYASLKTNIQHHQAIILCVNELEAGMSDSTYVTLAVNALTICLHAFGFVELFQGGGKGPAVVKRLLACPIYMGQTALFCLYGQSLIDHSERLLDSAFSCGWPAGDRRFCSALIIFMQQASQPLKIRVGKIVTLSRNSFLQIMNVSYTIFNMLLNTQ